jgi:hypothetical protein
MREHNMARKFGNLETQKLYDKTHGNEAEEPKSEFKEEGAEQTDHENVVAEHGKAHTIHIKHDHEAQHSHVVSHHEDGHKHEAHFHGEQHHVEAHDHAAKMAGSEEHENLEDKAAEALNEAGHPGNYEKASALGVGPE